MRSSGKLDGGHATNLPAKALWRCRGPAMYQRRKVRQVDGEKVAATMA